MRVNKKNNENRNKSITAKSIFLSAVIVVVSVHLEICWFVIWLFFMSFDSLLGNRDRINTMMHHIMVDVVYNLVLIFITFITIIIIFKLVVKCKISKKIWIILVECTVISIVFSIVGGVFSEDILSKLSLPDVDFLPLFTTAAVAMVKINVIEIVHIINRCLLVILSTYDAVNQ
ncbi:MAG: hypothetical protein NC240_02025 [Clostridium sp.]|nr:hypothetical protein [Clostridium sp.]